MASLFDSPIGKSLDKPQNKFTASDNKKIESQLVQYMTEQGADSHGLKELAAEIREMCFSDRVKRTAPSAAEVWLSSADKISSMVLAGQKKIEELDACGDLEKMMEAIHKRIDREENPEAYI